MNKNKHYRHLFFDLDKTIYDFDKSSHQTFQEIYEKYHFRELGIVSLGDFIKKYTRNNLNLWEIYRQGGIEKKVLNVKRFDITLQDYGIADMGLAREISAYYIQNSPLKKTLFPGVTVTLEKLLPDYQMHIITNGFEEVQRTKIRVLDIAKYFGHVITSEEAGCKKPDPGIFVFALQKAGASASESLMIGDDLEVDIDGARLAGIDQVYVNYEKTPHQNNVTYEISSFAGLLEIL